MLGASTDRQQGEGQEATPLSQEGPTSGPDRHPGPPPGVEVDKPHGAAAGADAVRATAHPQLEAAAEGPAAQE